MLFGSGGGRLRARRADPGRDRPGLTAPGAAREPERPLGFLVHAVSGEVVGAEPVGAVEESDRASPDGAAAEGGRGRRRRLHAQAAEVLAKQPGAVTIHLAAQMARHYYLGGLPAEARRWAMTAGDYAARQLSPAEAST